MKLLGGTKRKITKYKIGENVPHLEVPKVRLVHYDFVNISYEQDPRALYIFLSNKTLDQLLAILPKLFLFLKTFLFYIFKE